MVCLRVEDKIRSYILLPCGLSLVTLSFALGGPGFHALDPLIYAMLVGLSLYVGWDRRRRIRRAEVAVCDEPLDAPSRVARRELLWGVPFVVITALVVSVDPFACFMFGLLLVVIVVAQLADHQWVERFERDNAVEVVRLTGFRWNSPLFAQIPRQKEPAITRRNSPHAQSEAP